MNTNLGRFEQELFLKTILPKVVKLNKIPAIVDIKADIVKCTPIHKKKAKIE